MVKPRTSSFIIVFVFCSCGDNKKPVFQNEEAFRNDVMFKFLKYTVLFRNTSFYVLAVLFDTPGTTWGSQTTAFLMYASITFVREYQISILKSDTLRCVGQSCPNEVQTLPYIRDCKLRIFNRTQFKNVYKNNVFEYRAEFFLRESKSSETKALEEYCWTITQAAGRSSCGWSGSRVLECGFNWTLMCTSHNWPHVHSIPTCAQFDLRRPFQDVKYCVSRGLSAAQVLKRNCVCSKLT